MVLITMSTYLLDARHWNHPNIVLVHWLHVLVTNRQCDDGFVGLTTSKQSSRLLYNHKKERGNMRMVEIQEYGRGEFIVYLFLVCLW